VARLDEAQISKAILDAYHKKIADRIASDVLIVGAGASGLVAALYLAKKNLKVTIFEKRLSPGGGIWGGAMGMNEIVVQGDALAILEEIRVRSHETHAGVHTADAMELASGLCLKAVQSGAVLLNLMTVEDVCIHEGRVSGVVANRTMIHEALPVDPLAFSGKAVVDATGHEATVVKSLQRRGLLRGSQGAAVPGEGPLDAQAGERFVVERVTEVYPGLWVTGMSVCATFGGPRMGPIFGGMLLSGKKVAHTIATALKGSSPEPGPA